MNIRQLLDDRISVALCSLGAPVGSSANVRPSVRETFGDYQVNGVMAVAKFLKQDPRELARTLLGRVSLSDIAERVEVAGPGFVNIHLKDSWLATQCKNAVADKRLGVSPAVHPQTIVVDYSGPNLAKEMHVGHLRSTIIGDAISRVLEFMGHNVIRQNHVGDWGTQFGMLIAQLVSLETPQDAERSTRLSDLEVFYRDAKKRFDSDPVFAARAREYVVRLQSGDAECMRLWREFIEVSMHHCEDVYERLGVQLTRADMRPESSYNSDLHVIVHDLQDEGLLAENQGAKGAYLDEFKSKDGNSMFVIVQKSDGGYLYATTDLAAIRYRVNTLAADRIIYCVDARQSQHFQQVFALARKAGFVKEGVVLEHLAFGMMLGEDGRPFKTRTGGTVKLVDLLTEAEERAYVLVSTSSPDLPDTERHDAARKLGISAVKYTDLSKHRLSDYVFSWEDMLSFDGNTALYLQYAYVRIRSIFRKAEERESAYSRRPIDNDLADEAPECVEVIVDEPAERALAIKLLQLDEILDSAARDGLPNLLCNYLYELSGTFMRFYESCPILKDGVGQRVRDSRLVLVRLTSETLRIGLGLLGIDVLDRL